MERWLEFMGITLLIWCARRAHRVVLCFEGQRNGRKISPQSLGILVKAKNAMLIDLRMLRISVMVTSVAAATFHIAKSQLMLMN